MPGGDLGIEFGESSIVGLSGLELEASISPPSRWLEEGRHSVSYQKELSLHV
jgi:hypothetical protein